MKASSMESTKSSSTIQWYLSSTSVFSREEIKGEAMEIIPWSLPYIDDKEKEFVNSAIDSTWLSMGPFVDDFEIKFFHIV